MMVDPSQELSDEEIALRRDDAARRALNTPHNLKQKSESEKLLPKKGKDEAINLTAAPKPGPPATHKKQGGE